MPEPMFLLRADEKHQKRRPGRPEPPPQPGGRVSAEQQAVVRAYQTFKRMRDKMLAAGGTQQEVDWLLNDVALVKPKVAPRLWPQLFDHEPQDRYCGGLNELGQTWLYDRMEQDEHGDPVRLMRVDPLTAQRAAPLMNQSWRDLGRVLQPIDVVRVVAQVHHELRDKFGVAFLEVAR